MKIRFTPEAESDLIEIEEGYLLVSPELPNKFFNELSEHLHFLTQNPEVGKPVDDRHRLFLLKRFPYFILYKIESPELVVVHLIHDKRHQNFRTKRIK